MASRHKHGVRGFTLIELLVVITVIAIIVAIIFPVFPKVRAKARQATCLSNERQLGMAVLQYVSDYDEMLPGQVSANSGNGLPGAWVYYDTFERGFQVSQGGLYSYLKSADVFTCPDDRDAKWNQLSYSMNACVAQTEPPSGGFMSGKNIAEFDNTSGLLLFGEEGVWTFPDPTTDTALGTVDDGHFQIDYTAFSTRHNGGSNVVYLDAHSKWLAPGQAVKDQVLTGGLATCP